MPCLGVEGAAATAVPTRASAPFDAFWVRRTQSVLGIVPIGFPPVGYCPRCEAFVSARTCPHRPEWLELSGTALRAVLRSGGDPPRELVRPEIAAILREHFRSDG